MAAQDFGLCHNMSHIDSSESPRSSALMFAAGLFGNVAALVILEIRRRRDVRTGDARRRSLFHILITLLVFTDLAGTCLISPVVLLSYSRNTTLEGMSPQNHTVCRYIGVSMTFFGLATMSLLFTMALERCFAIGYPYLYSRHDTKKCAYITIPVVLLLCALFCLLPFAGFGNYVQYCPGTWCFIDMNPQGMEDRAYANLYASIMLVLVLAVVACNGFVMYQLIGMYRRRRRNCGSVVSTSRSSSERKAMSMAEEVGHLILLVVMTIVFIVCMLPLVVRVYINSTGDVGKSDSHHLDLVALRFISFNCIFDPWVFILLSPSVLHFCWAPVCRTALGSSRGSVFKSTMAKETSPAILELSCPTLDYTKHFHSVETL